MVQDLTTGKPIPGATVRMRNRGTGTQATVITAEDGKFSEGPLPPGEYDIDVSANGYTPVTKQQKLYTMQNYTVLPDPFELAAISAVVTPPVTTDPTVPAATPQPTPAAAPPPADSDGGGSSEGIGLNPRRVGIFDDAAVVGLPLGSTTLTRTFDELAFLVAGVNPPPQAIGNSVGPGVGSGVGTSGQFSVNGLRSRANNFTVDGSDNNDEDIGVRRQGFFSLVPQPIESIQEYQITTLLAPAEFGRNLGAQVNAVSRSGGSQFHGHIWGLLNHDSLNATNYFDNDSGDSTINLTAMQGSREVPVFVDNGQATVRNNAGEKDALSLLQGGFAIGGTIIKNKAFFFVSGEAQRLDATQERHFAVPSIAQRGLLDSGATGITACPAPIAGGCGANLLPGFPTSVSGDIIFSLFPFPNDPNGVYGRNTYTQALSADAQGAIFSGRLDLTAFEINGNPQTFTARYNFTNDRRDLTDVGGALFSAIRPKVRTDNFSTFLNGSLTTRLANELRFSWGRTDLQFDPLGDESGFTRPVDSRLGPFLLNAPIILNVTRPDPNSCTPTGCVAPPRVDYATVPVNSIQSRLGPIGQLHIAGFSPVGVDVFNFPQERTNDTFQIADTVRWTTGSHSIAFGTDIRRVYLESDLPRNSRPLVTFYGGVSGDPVKLNDLIIVSPQTLAAAGAPGGFFQSIVLPGRDAKIDLSYTQYNFFAQDEWRISPRFNLSFGLRYEYNGTPKEADQKIESTFAQTFGFPFSGLNDFIAGRRSIYDVDKNNFAPRLGFAFSPSENTVVRGGYGIYYDQVIGSVVAQSRNVFPTFTTANFGGGVLADNRVIGFPIPFPIEAFTLFNPAFAVFDPASGFVCNLADASPLCSAATSIPLLQPGTLNTFNPALTASQLQQALTDIFLNFPRFNGNSFGATIPGRDLDTPLSHQYSIGVEHSFNSAAVVSAAYVGTTGRSLLRSTTPNLGSNYIAALDPFFLLAANGQPIVTGSTVDPFVGNDPNSVERPNPNIGSISSFETVGRSRYHSLQLGLRGRLQQNRFRYQANYVLGNAKDDVSDVFDLAGSSALPQNSLTFDGEYGPANFDVRHRFTYNFVYDLPTLQNKGSFASALLNGWTLWGSGEYYSGQPFTVNTVYDINHDGNLTDRINSTQFISDPGQRVRPLALNCSGVQCQSMLAPLGFDGSIPRNSFRAGSVLELDLSLSRKFSIRENHNLQFRMDIFNFINRANFGVPVRFLEAPGFGSAVETVTPARRIQFGLKYNF